MHRTAAWCVCGIANPIQEKEQSGNVIYYGIQQQKITIDKRGINSDGMNHINLPKGRSVNHVRDYIGRHASVHVDIFNKDPLIDLLSLSNTVEVK